MKTNSVCCHALTKKISKRVITHLFKAVLLLFFFLGISSTAFAQNSCLISGDRASAPYPAAVIKVGVNPNQTMSSSLNENVTTSNRLKYRAASSVPSSYLWTISNNTSGAKIFEPTSQVVIVEPGYNVGSFTLTCQVTKLADSESVNTCTVSVAVVPE